MRVAWLLESEGGRPQPDSARHFQRLVAIAPPRHAVCPIRGSAPSGPLHWPELFHKPVALDARTSSTPARAPPPRIAPSEISLRQSWRQSPERKMSKLQGQPFQPAGERGFPGPRCGLDILRHRGAMMAKHQPPEHSPEPSV